MPKYSSPRIYVEEIEIGAKSVEGVSTEVAGFVGMAVRGDLDKPALITRWGEFVEKFGRYAAAQPYLSPVVYGFLSPPPVTMLPIKGMMNMMPNAIWYEPFACSRFHLLWPELTQAKHMPVQHQLGSINIRLLPYIGAGCPAVKHSKAITIPLERSFLI